MKGCCTAAPTRPSRPKRLISRSTAHGGFTAGSDVAQVPGDALEPLTGKCTSELFPGPRGPPNPPTRRSLLHPKQKVTRCCTASPQPAASRSTQAAARQSRTHCARWLLRRQGHRCPPNPPPGGPSCAHARRCPRARRTQRHKGTAAQQRHLGHRDHTASPSTVKRALQPRGCWSCSTHTHPTLIIPSHTTSSPSAFPSPLSPPHIPHHTSHSLHHTSSLPSPILPLSTTHLRFR